MRRAGALLVFIVVAACGGADGQSGDTLPEPVVSIDGDWVATGLVVDGAVIAVNPPTVSMTIVDEQVAGVAACNSYAGTLDIGDDGSFTLGGLAITEMACEPADVMATEAAVLDAFAAIDTYELTDELVLTSDDGATSMTLVRATGVALDGSWAAVGATVAGVEVSDLDAVSVTMDVGAGRISGASGCNSYEIEIEVSGDSLTFGPRTATEAFCSGPPGEIEGLFSAATTGSATWVIEGDLLTLTNGAAVWVFERIDGEPLAPPATTSPPATSAPAARVVGAFELRPVGSCFPDEGEGPAPDGSLGQAVLPDPGAGTRCIVGAPIGPGPVLGPPTTVSIDPATQTWVVSPSVLPDGRAAWDQLTETCFERVEPCASGQIAIVVDGSIVSAPTVVQPTLPEVQISGDFTEIEARALADAIDAGQPVSGRGSGGGLDGPVMFAGPDAIVAVEDTAVGTLFLGDNCLGVMRDDGVTVALVIWPFGTTWQPDGSGVVLPSGEVLGFGPVVQIDGAVIDDTELAAYADSPAVRDEITRCRRTETTLLFVAA